ncbi:GNAT family N-acetyltransferase, partial [Kribbia dieselivorans]|uniref:GNAT family N-acetyltransferase n=1 Tax=Kribbia dieselivorans TaxID=331526 RepID=UPI000AC657CD
REEGEHRAGILGYAGLDHGGEVADVMTIVTAPAARGRGLGRVLLDELITRARDGGADHLMLEVRADNDPALGLYRSRGFTHLQTRRRYYQPGDVDALILRLDLRPTPTKDTPA